MFETFGIIAFKLFGGEMKAYTEYLTFNTKKLRELIRITDTVKEAVKKSGVKEGLCLVSAMHLTAAVIIQDDEEGLHEDIWEWLERLAPFPCPPHL